jgi:uncharacterized Zn-binding protein involved in type VI secretion
MGAAARATDMHTCPLVSGTVPHVGGPLLPGGNATVMIGGVPASIVGDTCVCAGPTDSLVAGSSSVMIGGKPWWCHCSRLSNSNHWRLKNQKI